jgi:hypothetical protein
MAGDTGNMSPKHGAYGCADVSSARSCIELFRWKMPVPMALRAGGNAFFRSIRMFRRLEGMFDFHMTEITLDFVLGNMVFMNKFHIVDSR